jgi:hypothetical protein
MAAARENIDSAMITTIGILLVVLTFVLVLLVEGWFYKAQHDEYLRKVVAPRSEALASAVADQQERLHSYRMLDKDAGQAAIPIERAMELGVREGL